MPTEGRNLVCRRRLGGNLSGPWTEGARIPAQGAGSCTLPGTRMTDHAASTATPETPALASPACAAGRIGCAAATTPLHARHRALGARMVPFAGYDMPVQYPDGHPRRAPVDARKRGTVRRFPHGPGASWSAPTTRRRPGRSRRWCPADIVSLEPGQQRYTQLLNEEGGIIDDLMVTRPPIRSRTAS